MEKAFRPLTALSAGLVLAIAFSACGGGGDSVPADAVASVAGKAISKADYQHWASVTAKGAAGSAGAALPDPPSYAKCIAATRKATKVKKGQPAPTDASLRDQCKQRNEQITQQTMATLLQAEWINQEASAQDVSVSDAEISKQLDTIKKQSFPTKKAFDSFLKQSGMTTADVNFRVRVQALAQKITQKVQRSAAAPTDKQIAAYYARNRAQFDVPQRRDLQEILTRSRGAAEKAKQAVEGGMSWKAAAKKYSVDPASRATGGVIRGVAQGQQDRALDKAAFAAKKNVLLGPIKGQFGWYLVRVTAITPGRGSSLQASRAQIKTLLAQQNQQQKMSAFATGFQKRWAAKTNCRAGYVVPLCKNAPKPRTTTSTTSSTAAGQ